MAKRQISVREVSYGVYDVFDGSSVPRIQTFGDRIPAVAGTEFGMVWALWDREATSCHIGSIIHASAMNAVKTCRPLRGRGRW